MFLSETTKSFIRDRTEQIQNSSKATTNIQSILKAKFIDKLLRINKMISQIESPGPLQSTQSNNENINFIFVKQIKYSTRQTK